MYHGWLQLGQTEIANGARTAAYMRAGVKNTTTSIVHDDSWPMLPIWLGREEEWYHPAADDDCPWYDPTEPASSEFAGVWPMRIDGLDTTPLDRDVIEAAVVGGGFGVQRTPPRVIEVEAVLVASTPSGLMFGLEWLGAVLRGDPCSEEQAGPRDLQFLSAMPPYDPSGSVDTIRQAGDERARLVSQVVATSPLKVEEWFSPWIEGIAPWTEYYRGACCARVSWSMTAGVPWVWRRPIPLVRGLEPALGEPESVRFENVGKDGSCPSLCMVGSGLLVDPRAPLTAPLPRPVTPAAAQGCLPFESRRTRWVLEAGRISRWSDTIPTVTIRTGPQEERNLRLQWVEGRLDKGEVPACDTVGEVMVSYVPARATLTLDAITGKATVVTHDQRTLDAVTVTTGRAGAPWRPPILRCARAYTLVIDTAQTVHRDVRIDIDAVVRQQ